MVRVLDHYSLLGVPTDSPAIVIKKAYRALALKHHPDKNPENGNAQNNFQMLQNAYDVLIDVKSRKNYDRARTLNGVSPSSFLPSISKASMEEAHTRFGRATEEEFMQERKRWKAKEAEKERERVFEEAEKRRKAKEAEEEMMRWREEQEKRRKVKEAKEEQEKRRKEKEAEEEMVKWWEEQEEKRRKAMNSWGDRTNWWEGNQKRQEAEAEEDMLKWLEEEMDKAARERTEREQMRDKAFQSAEDIDMEDWIEEGEDIFGSNSRNSQTNFDQGCMWV